MWEFWKHLISAVGVAAAVIVLQERIKTLCRNYLRRCPCR